MGCGDRSSFVLMNATDSLLLPLADAGRLNGLSNGALGARYRFWRDADGVRHVFSVYPADQAPDYPDAIALVTRRTPAGPIAMWAGRPGADARRMAERLDAEEIHIHVFGDAPAPALRGLIRDRAPIERATPRPADSAASLGLLIARRAAA